MTRGGVPEVRRGPLDLVGHRRERLRAQKSELRDALERIQLLATRDGLTGLLNRRAMMERLQGMSRAGRPLTLALADLDRFKQINDEHGHAAGDRALQAFGRSAEQMLAKVKAMLDARRDPDLFIVARTDAASIEGQDAAIERCQLFMEAGVDMAKPMGFDTIPDIKRAIREIPGPHMATLSQAAGRKARSLSELEAAGVCSATFPSLPLFAAAHAVRNVCRILKNSDSLEPCQDHLVSLDDYYGLVGLKDLLNREETYDKAAAALVQKRAAE